MKMRNVVIIGAVFAIGLACSTRAEVIIQASNVWTDGSPDVLPIGNTIDQSGLSSTYTSGVDDFDSFVAGTTASFGTSAFLTVGGTSSQLDNFYFDLGSSYEINAMAVWNQSGTASLNTFDIYSSADIGFTSTTLLGSYSIGYIGGTEPSNVFSFIATDAQYFMIDVTSNYGYADSTRVNEVAFAAIPEPASLGLIGLVTGGIYFARRFFPSV